MSPIAVLTATLMLAGVVMLAVHILTNYGRAQWQRSRSCAYWSVFYAMITTPRNPTVGRHRACYA